MDVSIIRHCSDVITLFFAETTLWNNYHSVKRPVVVTLSISCLIYLGIQFATQIERRISCHCSVKIYRIGVLFKYFHVICKHYVYCYARTRASGHACLRLAGAEFAWFWDFDTPHVQQEVRTATIIPRPACGAFFPELLFWINRLAIYNL